MHETITSSSINWPRNRIWWELESYRVKNLVIRITLCLPQVRINRVSTIRIFHRRVLSRSNGGREKKFSRDDVTSFKFECMELRPRHPVRRMATWKIDGSWWGRRDVVYHAVKKKKKKMFWSPHGCACSYSREEVDR